MFWIQITTKESTEIRMNRKMYFIRQYHTRKTNLYHNRKTSPDDCGDHRMCPNASEWSGKETGRMSGSQTEVGTVQQTFWADTCNAQPPSIGSVCCLIRHMLMDRMPAASAQTLMR